MFAEDYSDESPQIESDVETPTTQESNDEDELLGEESLMAKLATWKIENHIEFSVCDQLLKILKPYHPEIPLSTRTLVKTPRKAVILQTIPPGNYYHFGIEKGILDTLLLLNVEELLVNPVQLELMAFIL